jgi:hypothetical protein
VLCVPMIVGGLFLIWWPITVPRRLRRRKFEPRRARPGFKDTGNS